MKTSLFENYRVKLIVVLVAIVFWLAVVTENDYDYDVEVPIVVANVPRGKTIVGSLPETARVRFRGKGKALLALLFYGDSKLLLDLSDLGTRSVVELNSNMIQVQQRGVPALARHLLEPKSVTIELANLRRKKVKVTPAVAIKTLPGYTVVGEISTEPDSVTISGPEEFVARVNEARTVSREFLNLRMALHEDVELQPFPDSLQIELSRTHVNLIADIQKIIERTIPEIPVEVRNAPANLIVTPLPSTLSLTVEGGEQLLFSLKRDDITAFIDYNRVHNSGKAGYAAYIEVPPGVRYRNVKPALFKLMMERGNSATARN